MTEQSRIAEIAGRHFEYDLDDGYPTVCGDGCDQGWPCDAQVLLAQLATLTERAERAEAALRELADHHGKEHTSFAGCALVDIHVNRALAKSLSRDEETK